MRESEIATSTITAHITVRGAAKAADWYKNVFSATEVSRVPVPDGRLMSVVLAIGGSRIHVADEFPEWNVLSPQSLGGTAVTLTVSSRDVDPLWKRAIDSGAQVVHALADAFWGERHGVVVDPFGHRWGLTQHLREVPNDELVRQAAKLFGGAGAPQ